MSKRYLGSTMKVLGSIDAGAKRFYNSFGEFDFATFEMNGVVYKMISSGDLFKMEDNDTDWIEVKPRWCKKGIYPEVTISGVPIKSYTLALTLADVDFYTNYMSDSNLVVNHTVEGNDKVYDGGKCFSCPLRSVSYNPKYLELVTVSQNNKHGAFVSKYGLNGVFVSAKDVDVLLNFVLDPCRFDVDMQDVIIDYNKSIVVDFYKNRGYKFDLLLTV